MSKDSYYEVWDRNRNISLGDIIDYVTNESMSNVKDKIDKLIQDKSQNNSELKVYTVSQVAEKLGKCDRTILNHIKKGLLVAKKSGKSYKISHNNLINYING